MLMILFVDVCVLVLDFVDLYFMRPLQMHIRSTHLCPNTITGWSNRIAFVCVYSNRSNRIVFVCVYSNNEQIRRGGVEGSVTYNVVSSTISCPSDEPERDSTSHSHVSVSTLFSFQWHIYLSIIINLWWRNDKQFNLIMVMVVLVFLIFYLAIYVSKTSNIIISEEKG